MTSIDLTYQQYLRYKERITKIPIGNEIQTKRRWTTPQQVLARIKELETLPPIRTVPTDHARLYRPIPVDISIYRNKGKSK